MIEEINDIIEWYTKLHSGYNNINELMYYRQRLAGLATAFASSIGEARKVWNNAQAIRENKRAKIEMKEVISGTSGTKATLIAKANTHLELTTEKKAEGMYHSMAKQYDSIKEVLSAMNQHISQAKEEWKIQKYLNQSQA